MKTKEYFKDKDWCLYKKSKNHQIKWVDLVDFIGHHYFTFDEETFYNLFADYPHNLSEEERAVFAKEEPYWTDFFKSRST